jgi:alpha-tubulin suppressor-like RCC1 family protein
MPTFYNFTENGVVYSFDDIFVPADIFREGNLWTWGVNGVNYIYGEWPSGQLGTNDATSRSTPVTTFAGGSNWKQVSSGGGHTAAIKTDGTLWTWGRGGGYGGFYGSLGTNDTTDRSTPVTTFAGGTNWKQVGCGNQHTAAIKTDGTLWTWGSGSNGQLGTNATTDRSTPVTTFAGGTNWKQVSSGNSHTAAIKTDGTLWTWGLGTSGQLGTNDTITRTTPVTTFAGGTNWKQVSGGGYHTAAIKTDGTLWTWGNGGNGRLGNNATTSRSTPVTTFAGGTNWKQVSSGSQHTAAIKTDGTLWTWGYGTSGRLGRDNNYFIPTPVTTFAGGTNWVGITTTVDEETELYTLSGGSAHTAAIKTDGTLWTWGDGSFGQLGTNDTTQRNTPVTTFAGGTNWKQVSGGFDHTAAIKTDGTLWTWGYGGNGRLGTNDAINRSTPVTTFAGGTNWKQVSSGNSHTAAIKTDGTLWTWGNGFSGQLGNNAITNRTTPVTTFAGGTNWKQVSSGTNHTAAIKTDGTLWTWGNGGNGRLGNNAITDKSTPVTTFAGGTNWKQVSGGNAHTAAIKTDGTLWTWGLGNVGQLGTNATTDRSTPVTTFAGGSSWKQVSGGSSHTAAIKTDGTLWTWGYGGNGRLGTNDAINRSTPVTTFAGGSSWKQVSSGSFHTAALSDDGLGNKQLYLFGFNNSSQLGVPLDTLFPGQVFGSFTNWKQVSSGSQHTAAIKTDGTLWTWGYGTSGRLGTNDTTNRSTPVTTFAGGSSWKQVSSGNRHTAALTYEDPVI